LTRFLSPILIVPLVLASIGCGNVFINGAINPGSTMTGSVTAVQLANALNGSGTTVQVTFVTFFQNGFSSTIGFCDDQTARFPLDQSLRVNFNPGQPCATIIVVIIV
jgi:hypothetical protein